MGEALLVLRDGTWFAGEAFGASGETIGEVVFNTSMSGYQEILTDPSYRGQIVTMTAPHIGNYGVNPFDVESDRVQAAGLVVREAARRASNYRATQSLNDYLVDAGTVAITGVDTRAVTRRIRNEGAVMGAVVHDAGPADVPEIVERIAGATAYDDRDFVGECSVPKPTRVVAQATGDPYQPIAVRALDDDEAWPGDVADAPHVVVLDFGVKMSIVRNLLLRGLRVTLAPHDTTADEVRALAPDGFLLSNGPGNPARLDAPVATIRELVGERPTLGICLGHQLLARALGAETFKLTFGHRGPNQPVLDQRSGRVEITAQNHGYAVALDSVPEAMDVTHVNLNDKTIEGFVVTELRALAVQHHPEAGPGPNDALHVFDEFVKMLR